MPKRRQQARSSIEIKPDPTTFRNPAATGSLESLRGGERAEVVIGVVDIDLDSEGPVIGHRAGPPTAVTHTVI